MITRLVIGLGALILWAVLYFAMSMGIMQGLEERGTDFLWRSTATTETERRVVVVDVDDQSLAQLGPWPWTPTVMAELVRQLDRQGAKVKLFDMVFPQERQDSAEFFKALAQSDPWPNSVTADKSNHAAIGQSPILLAQVFALRGETTLQLGNPISQLDTQDCHSAGVHATGVIANVSGLHHRAGHITPTLDADGTVRHVPALVCFLGRTYPALSLAAFSSQNAEGRITGLTVRPGVGLTEAMWMLETDVLPGHHIGVDAAGQIRVPYRQSRQAFLSVSAADVMMGRIPSGMLNGAWVVIGASAFGLSDVIPTALGGAVSGAEIHAQLLTALLDNQIPFTPRGAIWVQAGYLLLSLAVLLLLVPISPFTVDRRSVLQPLVAIALALGAYAVHAGLLLVYGWFIGWVAPALALVITGGCIALTEHARSQFIRSRLFQNLSSYISGSVAQRVALAQPSDQITAHRVDVTVLVADINNFSAYCEIRKPEDAASVLHKFYSTASDIVMQYGGEVQEMVGDRLLAVFNGTSPCPDHAMHAINAAREIWLRCGEELPNTLSQGLEPMSLSVGIETGIVLQGSFGASQRRVHTVLGQTVTVALRLCVMTNDLAYPILIGEGTAKHINTFPRIDQPQALLKPLGNFLLPTLRQGIKIYTPKHSLEISTAAELANLEYLKQKSFTT